MDEFDTVFNETVLKYEQELEENDKDVNGIKRYGLSLRFLKSMQDFKRYGFYFLDWNEEDVKALTVQQVKEIYRGEYWDQLPFEKILSKDLVNYFFDTVITIGIAPAVKLLKRCCWAIAGTQGIVKEDSVLTEVALDVINEHIIFVLPILRAERAGYYRLMAEKNPDHRELLEKWLKRCYGG